jgi:hypothetical protein
MACRPDLPRRGRSLRDSYTGFALGLPMVGAKILHHDQQERQPKGYPRHEVGAARVGRFAASTSNSSHPPPPEPSSQSAP